MNTQEIRPNLPSEIIAIAVLILLLVLLVSYEPCKDEPLKYDSLYMEIDKRDAEIAALEEMSMRYQKDFEKEKAKKDSILSIRPVRRQTVATLPDHVRDSLFTATTDTVSVEKDYRLATVEVHRITASNVIFSDLAESNEIIGIQERQIEHVQSELKAKDGIIDLMVENDSIQEEIIDGKSQDVAREKKRADSENRKKTIWKILAPIGFALGLLI